MHTKHKSLRNCPHLFFIYQNLFHYNCVLCYLFATKLKNEDPKVGKIIIYEFVSMKILWAYKYAHATKKCKSMCTRYNMNITLFYCEVVICDYFENIVI